MDPEEVVVYNPVVQILGVLNPNFYDFKGRVRLDGMKAEERPEPKFTDLILDNISEWIVISDKDYRIVYMNRAAREAYGGGRWREVFQGLSGIR
jgi:PAS domain-containing protein